MSNGRMPTERSFWISRGLMAACIGGSTGLQPGDRTLADDGPLGPVCAVASGWEAGTADGSPGNSDVLEIDPVPPGLKAQARQASIRRAKARRFHRCVSPSLVWLQEPGDRRRALRRISNFHTFWRPAPLKLTVRRSTESTRYRHARQESAGEMT